MYYDYINAKDYFQIKVCENAEFLYLAILHGFWS